MSATRTLYHPTLAGVTQDVRDSEVESWAEAGWRKTKPATEPATETTTKTGKA